MAVMSLRWLVAAAASLPAVSAGMGREQLSPGGAVQTQAPQLKDAALHMQFSPVVTARPAARGLLQKRETNTCGYLNGDAASDYVCSHTNAQCLFNTDARALGCCLTTSCAIYTACLPFASSAATKTFDKERTRYCSNSDLPSCAVFSIADPSNTLSGYTIPTCDSVSTTYTMYLKPTTASSSSRRTSSSKSSSKSSAESSSESSESPSPTGEDTGGSRAPAETSADASATAAPASSSTPVGPIVGGVVGGLAGLGLLGLGIFFLVRRNNTNPTSPSSNAAAPVLTGGPAFGPPGGGAGPQGQQSPYPPTYANQTPPPQMAAMGAAAGGVYDPYDPRYSVAKPAGASSVHPMQGQQQMGSPQMSMSGVSPSNSPSPVYHPQMQGMGAPPMGLGVGMGGGTPPPQQGHYGMGTPPPGQQGYGMGTPPPQQYGMGTPPPPMGQQNGGYAPYPGPPQQMQQGHGAVELPTQRGDGQVHELS